MFGALLWTRSNSSTSFQCWGLQSCTQTPGEVSRGQSLPRSLWQVTCTTQRSPLSIPAEGALGAAVSLLNDPGRACAEPQRERRGPAGAAAALERREAAGGPLGLCLLCGLPAAGKSTLARGLSRRLPRGPRWACALLPYDQLIPPEACGPRWKRSRRELLECLESLLRALLGGAPLRAPAAASRPAWERFLGCCRQQGLLAAGAGCPPRAAASRPLYIILDDNFYYRSMRYEVYQLARKYSLSFCQLFLECPLECCLQRNRLRSHPLPDQTICLMARKIEVPDLKKNAWEQNSLILKSVDCPSEDDEQIISFLATALENPVKQNEENTEQKEADRAICAASAVHQADQTCRRIISQAMKDAKDKNVLSSEMKSLAEELNKLKAEFLEDLRQGKNLQNQICPQDLYSDPASSVFSSFQDEASSVVNEYILK